MFLLWSSPLACVPHTRPHTSWTYTKNTPQTCFVIFSNCPRPSHITCPFSPTQFHSSVQPASVPKLWPAFAACTHQWTWWQNLASLNPTFGISWKIAACMHISYPWVLTGPLHLRAHPSFSPNWPELELAALRAHHDCSYIQHELKKYLFYTKRTTSTTSIRMQFELFLSQWFFFLEVVNS